MHPTLTIMLTWLIVNRAMKRPIIDEILSLRPTSIWLPGRREIATRDLHGETASPRATPKLGDTSNPPCALLPSNIGNSASSVDSTLTIPPTWLIVSRPM